MASRRAVARRRASVASSRASVGGSPPTDTLPELEREACERVAAGGRQAIRGVDDRLAREARARAAQREVLDGELLTGAIADLRRPFEIELLPIRGGGHVEREAVQGDVGGGRGGGPVRPQAAAQARSRDGGPDGQHAAAAPFGVEGDAVDFGRVGPENDVARAHGQRA